jgi:hypothetical protein
MGRTTARLSTRVEIARARGDKRASVHRVLRFLASKVPPRRQLAKRIAREEELDVPSLRS